MIPVKIHSIDAFFAKDGGCKGEGEYLVSTVDFDVLAAPFLDRKPAAALTGMTLGVGEYTGILFFNGIPIQLFPKRHATKILI